MNLGSVVIGLLTIGFGAASVRRGFRTVAGELGGGTRGVSLARAVRGSASKKGKRPRVRTVAGEMRLETQNVRTLEERVARIRELTKKGRIDPRIVAWSRRVLSEKCNGSWCIAEKDTDAEIKALYKAIRQNMRYTSDPVNVDLYAHPAHSLSMRGGDCDEFTSVSCAALESVGIPCRMKVIRTKGASDWDHIYALAGTPKRGPTRWRGFDTSVAKFAGWEPPARMVSAARVFSI